MLRTLDLRGQSLSPAELLAAVPRATAARSEALATAAGWEYRRVDPRADLDGALTPAPGRTLVEVALAR